jgi:hypothetical protein
MDKVIRDGRVAVIYSPGFGAGWYSWNNDYPGILFDPRVVAWIENNKQTNEVTDLESYLEETYPQGYFSLDNLRISWIPVGTMFRINEYDGSESIVYAENQHWHTA